MNDFTQMLSVIAAVIAAAMLYSALVGAVPDRTGEEPSNEHGEENDVQR